MHQQNVVAKTDGGTFVDIKCESDGSLSSGAQTSDFGETLTTVLTPIIQETFPYTVNTRIWDITSTAAGNSSVSHDSAKVVLSTGDTINEFAQIVSRKKIKYRAGLGVVCRFTSLWEEQAGSSYSSVVGVGDATNGFAFYRDETGTAIRHTNAGVDQNITQANWVDPCDGIATMPVIDFSFGNVFEIRYQYLGYGAVKFYIKNPSTGSFQLVHTIRYANTNVEPSLSNATLPFRAYIANDGTEVIDTKMEIASVGCFIEGVNKINDSVKNTHTQTKTATAAKEAVFTIRNNPTLNVITNNSIIYPTHLTISNTDNKTAIIRLVENTTLGGVPAYKDVDTKTSLAAIDVAGTTLTGGDIILTLLVAAGTTERINLKEYDIEINPTEILSISSAVAGGTAADVIYSFGFIEDQ